MVGRVELRAEEFSIVDGYLLCLDVVALGLWVLVFWLFLQQHLGRVGVL